MRKTILVLMLHFLSLAVLYSQNIGIGTNTPVEKLDVNGNSRISGYIRAQSIALNSATGYIPDASALIDMISTNQGVLVPRMSMAQRNAIVFPAPGLLIYQTNPGSNGFYYNNGTNLAPVWIKVGRESSDKGMYSFPNGFGNQFVVPAGISSIEFEAVSCGGGGGGGQIYNGSICGMGAGGGAGAFYSGLLKVNPGDIITVEIGSGGTGGLTNTTPTPGTNGTDATNLTIKVNGDLALEMSGGKGGAGGFSNGVPINGNVNGGDGGLVVFQNVSYIVQYQSAAGYGGGFGSSISVTSPITPGGFTGAMGQFNILTPSKEPSLGHGGSGGNHLLNGGVGISGYVKLKY